MTQEIEDDGIDKSQWVPEGEHAITPERAKALGLVAEFDEDGNEIYGRPERHSNVMRFLHSERFISDQELFDGEEFILWRQLFRAFFCLEKRTNFGSKGISGGDGTRERAFMLLLERLPKHHHKAIEYAVDHEAYHAADKFAIRVYSGKFQSAFASLSHHMEIIRPEVREAVKAEREAATQH